MCLIAFAWRAHPDYDLVLAANRDEFHARPTEAAHTWPDKPQIFAGRDVQAGGAWCGVNPDGRFAAVTNYRDMQPPNTNLRSRGWLVRQYLAGTQSAREFCTALYPERKQYGGFNLLVGDTQDLFYLSNHGYRGVEGVPPGVHALSNGALGDEWPKTRRAAQALSLAIGPADIKTERLFKLLADDAPAPPEQLPDTGIGEDMERLLSPVFVQSERYGTRASTVILRGAQGGLRFIERGFDAHAKQLHEVDQKWP